MKHGPKKTTFDMVPTFNGYFSKKIVNKLLEHTLGTRKDFKNKRISFMKQFQGSVGIF